MASSLVPRFPCPDIFSQTNTWWSLILGTILINHQIGSSPTTEVYSSISGLYGPQHKAWPPSAGKGHSWSCSDLTNSNHSSFTLSTLDGAVNKLQLHKGFRNVSHIPKIIQKSRDRSYFKMILLIKGLNLLAMSSKYYVTFLVRHCIIFNKLQVSYCWCVLTNLKQ